MHAGGSGLSLSPSQGRIGMKLTTQVSLEDMACMQQILRQKKSVVCAFSDEIVESWVMMHAVHPRSELLLCRM